jgi:hypothetical protein
MHRDPNEKSMAAQFQGFVPSNGISRNSNEKGLTYEQTWRHKRRTEDILIEKIATKTRLQRNGQTTQKVSTKKKGGRKENLGLRSVS